MPWTTDIVGVKPVGVAKTWPTLLPRTSRRELRCSSPSHRCKERPALLCKGTGRRNSSESQCALRRPGYRRQIAEKVGFMGWEREERAQELFFLHQVCDNPIQGIPQGTREGGCQGKRTNRPMACTAPNSGNKSHLSVHLLAKEKANNNQETSFFR